MGRYCGLPVEGSGGGTDAFGPGIQTSYERSMKSLLPMLAWPDLIVGAGLRKGLCFIHGESNRSMRPPEMTESPIPYQGLTSTQNGSLEWKRKKH
jgi:hypothetical protein